MHFEFLVEEPSADTALRILVPRIVGQNASFQVHVFQGKKDLLAKLPSRLRGYSRWLPPDWRIVVLVDRDAADCLVLKREVERIAAATGLRTRSVAPDAWRVVNRLAVEELEAWFFGDPEALRAAYPRIPSTLEQKAGFRDPDAIRGGTWEALERVLQRAGYFRGGLRKIEAARAISAQMDPARNKSHSFRVFRKSLLEVAGGNQ
jgi:hypothetical protein